MSNHVKATTLWKALSTAFPDHPFAYMWAMERPIWFFFRRVRFYKKCRKIFEAHGAVLNDETFLKWRRTDPQSGYEDAGGAQIRKIREAFFDGSKFKN